MRKVVTKALAVVVFAVSSMVFSASALAQEWPFVDGDYWEVTGISIEDGGGLTYANWLATEWRKNLEFAKSKGWIKDYMVLSNVYGRSDEADLYLIRVIDSVPSGAEGEQRRKEYMEWQSKSLSDMQKESGNRAEYREVLSSSLLQVMKFRD
jgi:hypothetical protein